MVMCVDQARHNQEAREVDVLNAGRGCAPGRRASLNSLNAAGDDSNQGVRGVSRPKSETSAIDNGRFFLFTAADGRITSHV
jgi:hypothetical protein